MTDAKAPAAHFSNEQLSEEAFVAQGRTAKEWFESAASLLRAARALERQIHLDCASAQALATEGGWHEPDLAFRAALYLPAAFLAAQALEIALKGVVLPKLPAAERLPRWFLQHEVAVLAEKAGISATDDAESEVLRFGEKLIRWAGRYPAPTSRTESSQWWSVSLSAIAACERLFLRCVELEASGHATLEEPVAKQVARYRERVAGVSAPYTQEVGREHVAGRMKY